MLDKIIILYFITFCILFYTGISLGIIKGQLDAIQEDINDINNKL